MSFITRCIRKIFCCEEEVILRDDKGSNYVINREEYPLLEEENLEHNKNIVSLYKGNDNIVYNSNIDNTSNPNINTDYNETVPILSLCNDNKLGSFNVDEQGVDKDKNIVSLCNDKLVDTDLNIPSVSVPIRKSNVIIKERTFSFNDSLNYFKELSSKNNNKRVNKILT
ncbi:hypothetical protein HERIO_317 [Hepatospora eriocheir]|uniref:Uncharacterized protein n=1 Tax=Hepatospora eriocheir TaxID=1081669 RepID=A0A1X0QDS8_9MICR|nr:hypothetical protein HERIO_317 [Hepatospora eriocheir]